MNNTDDGKLSLSERVDALIAEMSVEEKVSQLTNSAAGISRLGVKKYDWWNEALHGVARAGTATVFPQAIGLAATFNDKLIFDVADAISTEARAKYNEAQRQGVFDRYFGLTFWSPNVNIFRDPRWGRGQETYGEDPYLSSRMGVAFVKGLQGEGRHLKTAACAKHFAAHSGPEAGRKSFNSVVSKKDMNETYLPAFEACVKEAEVEAVMGSYNALNGVPCCCNPDLLIDTLRSKWGFKGHVVSDCGAIGSICDEHGYAEDYTHAAAVSLKNGCDLNCGTVYSSLTDAYESDLVTEAELDTALRRTLTARFKLGMFDEKTEYDDIPITAVACEKHKQLCLQAAKESLVLLKNDSILPLNKASAGKVAVIGYNGDSKDVLLGNYNGLPTQYSTVYSAMCGYLGEQRVTYAKGYSLYGGNEDDMVCNAVSAARQSDVTVLCLGIDATLEGEEGDANNPYDAGDRLDISIPASQQRLLESICEVTDRVIVVMMCGSAVAMSYADSHANAVIHAWYPGELGGEAITQLIFGEYSPSGRLPVTFYQSASQLEPFEDYSMKNRTYRYFTGKPLYEFGFGLSYTKFECSPVTLTEVSGSVTASLTVKNSGSFDSAAAVLLYLSEKNAVNQPIKRLTRFEKPFIKAGESREISFILGKEDFTHINDDGEKEYLTAESFDIFAVV